MGSESVLYEERQSNKPSGAHPSIENQADCMSCRLVGTGAFLGLAAFTSLEGFSQLRKQKAQILAQKSIFGMRSRQIGVAGLSLGFVYLAMLRWRA